MNPKKANPMYKWLIRNAKIFGAALTLLIVAILLEIMGIAYGLEWLPRFTAQLEVLAIVTMLASVLFGGILGFVGLSNGVALGFRSAEQAEKRKNEELIARLEDQANHTADELLDDFTVEELLTLREKLAEANLGLREDGILVPLPPQEQYQSHQS